MCESWHGHCFVDFCSLSLNSKALRKQTSHVGRTKKSKTELRKIKSHATYLIIMKTLTNTKTSAENLFNLLVAAYGRDMAELLLSVHGASEVHAPKTHNDDHSHSTHRHAA